MEHVIKFNVKKLLYEKDILKTVSEMRTPETSPKFTAMELVFKPSWLILGPKVFHTRVSTFNSKHPWVSALSPKDKIIYH